MGTDGDASVTRGMRIRSLRQSMRRPARSPWPAWFAWTIGGVVAVFLIAVAVRNVVRHDSLTRWRQELELSAGRPAWPEWSARWPALPSPPAKGHQLPQDLRGPYAYAARNSELLQHIPCYCGCVHEGHKSNLDCFIDRLQADGTPNWTGHAFTCPMCVDIAREVMLMSSEGLSLVQIRRQIDDHYRAQGSPTNTPAIVNSSRR